MPRLQNHAYHVAGRGQAETLLQTPLGMLVNRKALLQGYRHDTDKWIKHNKEKAQVRGLFLGTGESGKSTIFKQMRLSYGKLFDQFERAQYGKVIWMESLRSMRSLLDSLGSFEFCPDTHTNASLRNYAELLQSLDLSYPALIQNETDEIAKRFLASHVQNQEPRQPKAPRKGYPRFKFKQFFELPATGKEAENMPFSSSTDLIPLRERPDSFKPDRTTVAFMIRELWAKSPNLRRLASSRKARIDSNMPWFFDRIVKFADPLYLPNDDEVLHARIKTTGIISATFKIKGNRFEVVDVGGQRTERQKWIHCFDDATCILFVVSVGDYHVTRHDEDGSVNLLLESLQVFKEALSNRFLQEKPVALFLNKMDVLESTLQHHPFTSFFPLYNGDPHNAYAVSTFIEKMFRSSVDLPASSIYTYRTCATDRDTMKFVVEAVTNMVFIENLKWAGMM